MGTAYLASRRSFLASTTATFMIAGCGIENGQNAVGLKLDGGGGANDDHNQTPPNTLYVSNFYEAVDGSNLQPAFQAAIDHAHSIGATRLVNDYGPITIEMWAPLRTTPFHVSGPKSEWSATDGIPLVVRDTLDIDFRGATIILKAFGGSDRLQAQFPDEGSDPWIGGWLYAVGQPSFERLSLANVCVDGGYHTNFSDNSSRNLSDKGLRVQDTKIGSLELTNVELRNFGGEIYYVGGSGPKYQKLIDCHFHGSPQSAFNPGGVGYLEAHRLRAGNSYQAAEVLGSFGHRYVDCTFYDSPVAGGSFLGGPAPEVPKGFPFWWSYWDGRGDKPWISFENCEFQNCRNVTLGSWCRGSIVAKDTALTLNYRIGHLRNVDLDIISICDRSNGLPAWSVDGPPDLQTQVEDAPIDVFYTPSSLVSVRATCIRTNEARAAGRRHAAVARFYGGLVESSSYQCYASGEAGAAAQVHGTPANGFVRPIVHEVGFFAI